MKHDDPDVYHVPDPTPLPAEASEVAEVLWPLITERRQARINAALDRRKLHLAIVLDAVHDPHNTSAILRSADAFGVQRIHVVRAPTGFRAAHQVSKGSHRWLDLYRHEGAAQCVTAVRAQGYRLLYADMNATHTPEELRDGPPTAVIFGNEHTGVSAELRAAADGAYHIPMCGFVESLNVSVAAAITMHAATAGRSGDLPPAERDTLLARWLMHDVRNADQIIRERLTSKTR